ncbi:MAG: tripartite tricarboxylate transporter substrate binding protein [Burkholderiales bacterium]
MRYGSRWPLVCLLAPLPALAATPADYPSRPIRVIVPFTAGSGPDVVARLVGQKLSEIWKQPVVVDNRAGAAGTIAADLVAKAVPDGYTLLMASPSQVITVSLLPKLPYDFVRDLAPVSLVASSDYSLAANPQLPARSLRELVALAKARPGQLTYGSSGTGTVTHLAGEQLNRQAGITLLHVPYKGAAQVITDVMAGQISMLFNSVATLAPSVRAGKLRGIGVTAKARSPLLPEVPTFAEEGMPGFETRAWFGLLTTAGTPRGVTAKLQAEIVRMLEAPDTRERIVAMGMDPIGNTPAEFGAVIGQEIARYARLIKDGNIRAD